MPPLTDGVLDCFLLLLLLLLLLFFDLLLVLDVGASFFLSFCC